MARIDTIARIGKAHIQILLYKVRKFKAAKVENGRIEVLTMERAANINSTLTLERKHSPIKS